VSPLYYKPSVNFLQKYWVGAPITSTKIGAYVLYARVPAPCAAVRSVMILSVCFLCGSLCGLLLAALCGPLCGGPLLCGPLCGSSRCLLLAAFCSAFLRHSFSVICLSFVSLHKILFYFKALLRESIILSLPSPHLQRLPYCNTIGRPLRNIRPATDPPCSCHTPYNIGDGNSM